MKFEDEEQEFAKTGSPEQFTQTLICQYVQFFKQNAFLTCSRIFLISKTFEKLEFKLEKVIGI